MSTTSATDISDRKLLRWTFGFLRPVRGLVFAACLCQALWIGAEILTVRQTAEAVNRIQLVQTAAGETVPGFWSWLRAGGPEATALRDAVLWLALLSLAMALLSFFREQANMKLSMHKVFFIREAVYDKLQRVGMRFHHQISTGELINRALSDLQNVRAFINSAVLLTLEIVLLVGGYIVLLAIRAPLAAVLAIAPLPAWIWYTTRFSKRIRPAQQAVMEAGDKTVSVIAESMAGIHVVKAFATEPQEIRKYNTACDAFFEAVRERIRRYANFAPTVRGISSASHLALFLVAGVMILRGVLAPGDILMLGWAMGAILGRLQHVATINEQYQSAMVSARRLREVLAAEPTVQERPGAGPLPPGGGAVRFENVTFGYDPDWPVLHDVSFEVKPGQVVALVGPTGAGKSTLVQLLARFYDPQAGRILIDGVDVRDVALDNLRRQVAYVFQETYLFSDSVQANIAYGRPAVVGASIEAASRLAQAHEFVDTLPGQYRTVLGERGTTLSGGQRQRLAIARAIFSAPRILILDDATASVDPETEELIHGGVRFAMGDCTVFVVAHRLNTVKRADLVIVLESGRVTQAGTHDELMRREGHYREIAAVQLAAAEEETKLDVGHFDRVQDERLVREIQAAAAEAVQEEVQRTDA